MSSALWFIVVEQHRATGFSKASEMFDLSLLIAALLSYWYILFTVLFGYLDYVYDLPFIASQNISSINKMYILIFYDSK